MSTKAFKNDKVSLIKEKIDKAQVAIVTDYKGLTVEEITKLRRSLQKDGGDYMVTKNTLAKIAIKGTPYEVLADSMKGPIAIAFGFEDQVAPAKALSNFIKEVKKGEICKKIKKNSIRGVLQHRFEKDNAAGRPDQDWRQCLRTMPSEGRTFAGFACLNRRWLLLLDR